MDYPMHLGVTEAGDGEDGRVKSALGIGTLLEEGIGDTVRVSLTEDPVAEIPVARSLVERYNRLREDPDAVPPGLDPALRGAVVELRDPLSYLRRPGRELTIGPRMVGAGHPVLVEVPLDGSLSDGSALRRELDAQAGVRVPEETRAELVSVRARSADSLTALTRLRGSMELVAPRVALSGWIGFDWRTIASASTLGEWLAACHRLHLRLGAPLDQADLALLEPLLQQAETHGTTVLVEAAGPDDRTRDVESAVQVALQVARLDRRLGTLRVMLAMTPFPDLSPLQPNRLLAARLATEQLDPPIVLVDDPRQRSGDPLLEASIGVGGLLCDGIGDALQLRGQPAGESRKVAFGILQAARVRITRTEFISCPSCGRTLFDLEETTARIKQRTAHLKGLKIAVMGCIVNGPGEMADADFGYVGWGEDKIALFVGKEMVAKEIPTADADERLVELIKQNGRWVEPPVAVIEPV
jgi:(E)-4-hydroxy-3-methylbut-2-enyl-diphosphate synthase